MFAEIAELVHVDHRDRGIAVGTNRLLRQVDRRAAVRAVDELHLSADVRALLRSQRLDEALLAQEIDVRCEPAVPRVASPVLKSRRALHVMREQEKDRKSTR